jgi:nucleobase:cation symporter-1, NCS1 family
VPLSLVAMSLVGIFVTGATRIIYGQFIWDPVQVISKMSPIVAVIGCIGLVIATINTNVAANAVACSNDISNLNPRKISFKTATLITGALGVAIMPWKLLSSSSVYIYGWLGTYGIFLGPLAGIFIADYYIHRKKLVDMESLYLADKGRYWYGKGVNSKALYTWLLACILPALGLFIPSMRLIADGGWMIGFVIALIVYPILMKGDTASLLSSEENDEITEHENESSSDAANA